MPDEMPDWLMLDRAADLVAERLGILIGQAKAILQFEALPPEVIWQGDVPGQYVNHDPKWPSGRSRLSGLIWRPEELNRAWFDGAEIDWHECTMVSPTIHGQIGRVFIERVHLEAWLRKRLMPTKVPVPVVRAKPGPKTPNQRDYEIRRRIVAGERPRGVQRWSHEIRVACGVEASHAGYSDERIRKVTRKLMLEFERSV